MLFVNTLAHAQSFYAVLVADTRDAVLGAGCEKDLEEMSLTLQGISKKIGYQFQEIICHEDQFGKSGIQEAISKIQCNPDDILFFYYTGHGINSTDEKSTFPVLYFKDENLELEMVHRLLKAKNPRFCLTLADCCNNLLPRSQSPPTPVTRGITVTQDTKIMRDLFVEAHGDLLISSAKKGERATAHPQNGSFYSKTWIQALAYAGSNSSRVSWETLLADAENRLQETLKNLPDSQKHHSQWAGTLPAVLPAKLSEADKLTARRLTDLQSYISIIADQSLSTEQREQAVELAISLFANDPRENGKQRSPHVLVTRKNGTTASVPVRIYFKNLMHVKFDQVEITGHNASPVTDQAGLKILFRDITVKDTVPIPGFQ
ncbi:hypothetical protein GCM10010967_54430 [Dyadobacter beijingensis]|uniref:Peptidase C14 caspase domain-containing protein n=1 Tax=Dyadobacter beijingensis TaxID=365489 RepID=A0ABQ2IIV9_9BACT|nr:hypothetical protein GCM10010967_54430 [Dyadobacter beijingensis]